MSKSLGPNSFETDPAQPDEEFAFTVDFFSRLRSLEVISTVAVKVFDKAGVEQAGVLNGAAVIQTGRATDSEVLQNVHNLLDGERYNVQFLATTTAGQAPQILESDVFIPVKKITVNV